MIRPLAFAILLITATPSAAAIVKRCGWLHNPTPGNWWLTDRDGEWTLATQGMRQPRGMERMPDMTTAGWKKTNGNYGYGCACLNVDVDARTMKITRLHVARPVPLRSCRMDKRLPKP